MHFVNISFRQSVLVLMVKASEMLEGGSERSKYLSKKTEKGISKCLSQRHCTVNKTVCYITPSSSSKDTTFCLRTVIYSHKIEFLVFLLKHHKISEIQL